MSEATKKLPERLGHYRIVEEVGVGGLGRVFRAIDERTGNTVAVKVLHDKYTHNRKFLGIFHRELLIMAGMHHKHIVGYLDSYFEPPNCYIVTEFVEGWSGHYFLKQVGRVPPLVALSIVIDMMKGIDHLHLHDTIHSDLSASNILIDRSGRVMVTDFGLSCQMDVEDYKNYMIGTPGYYSPEHISEAAICPQTAGCRFASLSLVPLTCILLYCFLYCLLACQLSVYGGPAAITHLPRPFTFRNASLSPHAEF